MNEIRDIFTNGVGSRELLPEHDHKSDRESLAVPGCQALPPGYTLSCVQLFLNGGSDLGHLLNNFWAVHRLAPDMRERGNGLLVATLLAKPSGRLLEEEETDEHDAAQHELNRDGNPPLKGAGRDVLRAAIVCQQCQSSHIDPEFYRAELTKPVCKGAANDQHLLEQTSDTATNLRWRSFRDED